EQRRRLADAIALSIVHPDVPEFLDDRVVLCVFGNGFDAHNMPDAIDGFGHGLVDGVALQVLDESAVDLEIIDRQILEIAKRARARAEIVKRKQKTHRLAFLDELGGLARSE